jgi:hypothetical protein
VKENITIKALRVIQNSIILLGKRIIMKAGMTSIKIFTSNSRHLVKVLE